MPNSQYTTSTPPTSPSASAFSFGSSSTNNTGNYTSDDQPDLGAFRMVLREWNYLQPGPRIPAYHSPSVDGVGAYVEDFTGSGSGTQRVETRETGTYTESGRRSTVWAHEPIAQYLLGSEEGEDEFEGTDTGEDTNTGEETNTGEDMNTDTDTDTTRSVAIEIEDADVHSFVDDYTLTLRTQPSPASVSLASPPPSLESSFMSTTTDTTTMQFEFDFDSEQDHSEHALRELQAQVMEDTDTDHGPSLGYLDQALSFIAAERAHLAARSAWRHVVANKGEDEDKDDDEEEGYAEDEHEHEPPPSPLSSHKYQSKSTPLTPRPRAPSPLSPASPASPIPGFVTPTPRSYLAANILSSSDSPLTGVESRVKVASRVKEGKSKKRSRTKRKAPLTASTLPVPIPIPNTTTADPSLGVPLYPPEPPPVSSLPDLGPLLLPLKDDVRVDLPVLKHARSVPALGTLHQDQGKQDQQHDASYTTNPQVAELQTQTQTQTQRTPLPTPTRRLLTLARYLSRVAPAEHDALRAVERRLLVEGRRRAEADPIHGLSARKRESGHHGGEGGDNGDGPGGNGRGGKREGAGMNGNGEGEGGEDGDGDGDGEEWLDPRGRKAGRGDVPVHVFVDHSNILFGLLTYLKRHPSTPTPTPLDGSELELSKPRPKSNSKSKPRSKSKSTPTAKEDPTPALGEPGAPSKDAREKAKERNDDIVVPRILTRPKPKGAAVGAATTTATVHSHSHSHPTSSSQVSGGSVPSTSVSLPTLNTTPTLASPTSSSAASFLSTSTPPPPMTSQKPAFPNQTKPKHTTPIPLPSFATALSPPVPSNPHVDVNLSLGTSPGKRVRSRPRKARRHENDREVGVGEFTVDRAGTGIREGVIGAGHKDAAVGAPPMQVGVGVGVGVGAGVGTVQSTTTEPEPEPEPQPQPQVGVKERKRGSLRLPGRSDDEAQAQIPIAQEEEGLRAIEVDGERDADADVDVEHDGTGESSAVDHSGLETLRHRRGARVRIRIPENGEVELGVKREEEEEEEEEGEGEGEGEEKKEGKLNMKTKTRGRARHLSHTALALILERGRAVSRRVVVTSSPLYQPMETLERLGYEVRVYIRVPDLGDGMDRAAKNKGHKRHLSGGGTTSGDGSPGTSPFISSPARSHPLNTPTSSSHVNNLALTPGVRVRYREQGVDELLQLKLHQALAAEDEVPPGATIVLATGDGNVGQFSEDGFLGEYLSVLMSDISHE
ncbi:hypothetical protein C0991_004498 [Blastosporella zonata]|nr:hypothetical protein C0991_004498 [Blastosporella zonata]